MPFHRTLAVFQGFESVALPAPHGVSHQDAPTPRGPPPRSFDWGSVREAGLIQSRRGLVVGSVRVVGLIRSRGGEGEAPLGGGADSVTGRRPDSVPVLPRCPELGSSGFQPFGPSLDLRVPDPGPWCVLGVLISTTKALRSLKGFRRFAGKLGKDQMYFFFLPQFLILSSSFIYHKQTLMEHPLNTRCRSRLWEHTREQHHGNPCFRGGLRPNRRY